MAGIVKYSAAILAGTGKKGIVKPDANGYYTTVVGGLNTLNSAGEYYVAEGAKLLFDRSSPFIRRIQNGCLKAETGHPKMTPGMKYDDYVTRVLSIYETNVCGHFGDIWLDENFGRNNPQYNNRDLIAIMARVKPAGPNANALQMAFENPEENVCFSIRALTEDQFFRGVNHRVLKTIITFDWVTEPGISIANKYNSPALETLSEKVIHQATLETLIEKTKSMVAMEDTRAIALEALAAMRQSVSSFDRGLNIIDKW